MRFKRIRAAALLQQGVVELVAREAAHQACFRTRTPESLIRSWNAWQKRLGCRYIDVNRRLYDGRGRLRREIRMDGVHQHRIT